MATRVAWIGLLLTGTLCCSRSDVVPEGRDLPVWELEENLRIGSRDAPGQVLTTVVGPVISKTGTVYIGQPEQGEIRLYDRGGGLIGVAGGQGEGPGEFRRIMAMGIHQDTLWATDFSGRVNLFSLEGEPVGTLLYRSDAGGGSVPIVVFGFLNDGSVIGSRGVGPQGDSIRYLRLLRHGQVLDTLFSMEPPSLRIPHGAGIATIRDPFPSFPIFVVHEAQGRITVVDRSPAEEAGAASFQVRESTIDGERIYSERVSYEPIPIPDSVAADAVAGVMEILSRIDPERAEGLTEQHLSLPEFQVPVRSATYAVEGGLWIQLENAEHPFDRWLALGADGRPEAMVHVPPGVNVRWIEGDVAWGVFEDQLGVPYVVRLRLRREPG